MKKPAAKESLRKNEKNKEKSCPKGEFCGKLTDI